MTVMRVAACAGLACILMAAVAPEAGAAGPESAHKRPSQWAACRAWDTHVADLIEQHRLADDLTDAEFSQLSSRFHAAKSACWVGSFDEGLTMFSSIPIGRPKRPVSQLR
jgi:hypothetical protein